MSNEHARLVAGRYELREQLGLANGHAVWRAHDRQSDDEVVVKQPLPDRLADDGVRWRLEAEAEAVGRLDHPNIVPLRDAHFTADEAVLVFPLIEGCTLADRLADGAPLSPLEVARLGAALAGALAHAHGAGIAHRDVKPANILLAEDGGPRLLDFGIAATPDQASPAIAAPSATATSDEGTRPSRMVVGTLPYMAPEHLGGAPAHPAGDVYALSVVLYEMLAGQRPYQAVSPQTLVEEQSRPPASIDGAPPALMALVLAGLDPDPSARPSAAELSSRLGAWSARLPDAATVAMRAAAPATSTLAAVSARSRSGERGLGAVLLAGTVLLLGIAVSGAFVLGLPFAPAPTPGDAGPRVGADIARPAPTASQAPAVTVSQPGASDESQAGAGGSGDGERDKPKAKGKGKDKDKGKGEGKGRGEGGPDGDDDDDDDEDDD